MRALRAGALLSLLLASGAAAAQGCPPPPPGPAQGYRNDRFGFAFDVPPLFGLDPESIPPAGDAARFWTPDRRATAVVNASRNGARLTLSQLLAEAEGDIVQNSGGEITYRRRRDNWFVLSGYMVGRIFYRRTLLTRFGTVATLWVEFPRAMRDCLERAVTTMSLSFRER
jgi:hypothetical protein